MLLKSPKSWQLPESAATPESVFHDRRRLAKLIATGPVLLAASPLLAACEETPPAAALAPDPSAALYPVKRNARYVVERELTTEALATGYNNYYEFGSSKNISAKAQRLNLRPWMVKIDGLVEKPFEIGVDDLLAKMALEERVYRLRCVEAWAMTVPWSGFPLKALCDFARPLSSARYLKMTSFHDPDMARGQRSSWYPWPFVEGLTMAEARNELAFIATGIYGKAMPKQNGAPLRLAVPWKYGFKSAKGIVRFEFTDKRPIGFWEEIQSKEYGFWANVNPKVSHPRWSQATERVLGSSSRVPTKIYNGYGEYVAAMYDGLKGERLFV
jgi:methionine sulfoxide reductase catalytic subunit